MKVSYTNRILFVLYILVIGSILVGIASNIGLTKKKLGVNKNIDGAHTLKMKVMNFHPNSTPADTLTHLKILNEVLKEKYIIEFSDDDYDIILNGYYSTKPTPNLKNVVKIFYTSEIYYDHLNPDFIRKQLNDHDLVMGFDFIDHPNYLRMPYYYMWHSDKISTDYIRGKCNPNKKHFACFLVTNSGTWKKDSKFDGCIARDRLFHRLSLYKPVQSGGKHLNNIGKVINFGEETMEWLSQCKFTIAYENQTYPGYITEKPFQAYFANTVPIYYSHPKSFHDLNPEAVIYSGNFNSEDELVEHIIKVDNDDNMYCNLWNQKIIINEEKNYEFVKNQLRIKLQRIFDSKLY